MHDELDDLLSRMIALAPGDGRINALVRQVCGNALSLPPLPASVAVGAPSSDVESVVAEFAEQFSVDVSAMGDGLRGRLASALGESVFRTVILTFVADFVPRVRAGFEAFGLPVSGAADPTEWDDRTDSAELLFNDLLPGVALLRALDPVMSEIVGCAARASTTAGCASRCARAARWMPAGRKVCTPRSTATKPRMR